MDTSSEYTFPIFISSTDYNLKDFRAELARFLSEIGYRPILSSAEGFPDNSPNLEPWESCLPVLDKCFVTILIIDGMYGSPLTWKNYTEYFEDKKISPTHGEYVFAHQNKKRLFVFIRKEILTYYQIYRNTLRVTKDKDEAKNILAKVLPQFVNFETLEFIHEVKTTKPIPLIKEFDYITSVKKEIQKKLLNELAEIFLIKNLRTEIVLESFDKVINSLSPEEQINALSKLNGTRELVNTVKEVDVYKKDIFTAQQNLILAQKDNTKDKGKFEAEIKELNEKIKILEKKSQSEDNQVYLKDGKVNVSGLGLTGVTNGNTNTYDYFVKGLSPTIGLTGLATNSLISSFQSLLSVVKGIKSCEVCGKEGSIPALSLSGIDSIKECPSCKRNLCTKCWNGKGNFSFIPTGQICSACEFTKTIEAKPSKK